MFHSMNMLTELTEMEALADLLMDKAAGIKKEAHKARMKLAGVSTPAARKGLDHKERASLVAGRNSKLGKQNAGT
jgi:hypothetical protein